MPETLVGEQRTGPGRPPTGARQRILDAAYVVLSRDGYAGLTMAKVAAEAGQNQALIGYHFGGKQGLVVAVARRVTAEITVEVLEAIADADRIETLAGAALDAVWRLMDRDEGLQRVYFDLASQSIVDAEVQALMSDVKAGFRELLRDRLERAGSLREGAEIEAAATFVLAGLEGLALQRLDRGDSAALLGARRLWISAVAAALEDG